MKKASLFCLLTTLLALVLTVPCMASAEELPTIGFYDSSERVISSLIEQNVVGELNDTASFYLIWDPYVITEISDPRLTIRDRRDNEEVLTLSQDSPVTSADGTVTVTPEDGCFRIDAKVGRYRYFYGNISGNFCRISLSTGPVHLYMNDEIKRGNVWYQGEEYAVDFAFIGSGDALYLRMKPYMHTPEGEELDFRLFVGAIKNYDTAEETAATPDFYSCIKSINTEMVEWYNMDGTPNTSPNGRLSEVSDYTFLGCTTKSLQFQAEAGKTFIAKLVTTLTFQEPGQAEQTTTFEDVYIYYPEGGDTFVTLSAADADTADELTAILESNDALVSWLEREHGETWAKLKADALLASEVPATGGEIYLSIQLPGVTYTDIVTCGLQYNRFGNDYNMHLWEVLGSTDTAAPTVMSGLVVSNQIRIQDVSFVANDNCTVNYDEKTLTCGILAQGGDSSFGKYSTVSRCSFNGFDYGIISTNDGVVAAREGTQFFNCDVGYLIDSGARNEGMDPPSRIDFISCGTALQIKNLPNGETPYYYRVTDCNFVSNDVDIDVSQEGRFYFHNNFYGDLRNSDILSSKPEDVYSRTVRAKDHDIAMVITNPRVGYRYGEKITYIDPTPGLLTWIINSEADDLQVNSTQLNEDLNAADVPLAVTVVDAEEEPIGTWTLEHGEQAQTLSLLNDEEQPFNAGLTFGKDRSGNQTVTVKESAILARRQTVLTIPCDFEHAKIVRGGQTIASTTSDGTVTFAVTSGGTYTIKDGGTVLHDELHSSGLLFRDFGENRYAEVMVMDESIIVSVEYQSTLGTKGMLMTAVYDDEGKMLAVNMQPVKEVSAGSSPIKLAMESSNFSGIQNFTVKTFFLTAGETMSPQTEILFETTVSTVVLP